MIGGNDATQPAVDGSMRRSLDRLAAVALFIALVPIPLLGVGHPMTHVLTIGVVVLFGLVLRRTARSIRRAVVALDLGRPTIEAPAIFVAIAGALSGAIHWLIDVRLLDGRGGLEFYEIVLRQYGVMGAGGGVHWGLLVPAVALLLPLIVLDGVFFCGLLQQRIAAHSNLHAAVQIQSILFALPHTFAGPSPDLAYGIATYLGGMAYGYLYHSFRNHWIAASLLWLHVAAIWVLMLWPR